jgi:hypothetical protein
MFLSNCSFPLEMQIVYRNCNPIPGLVGIILLFDNARTQKENDQANAMFKVSI